MSSTQLDRFAAAALTGLLAQRDRPDALELAQEAFRIATAMMEERRRQTELPDSAIFESTVLSMKLDVLELPLRTTTKLHALGIQRVRDLAQATEEQIKGTGLGAESLNEIREALHRHALKLTE